MKVFDPKKYKEAVKECKVLVKNRREMKIEVVKKALSVCIIKEGNNCSHKHYTLSAFARDIGIAKGTLSRWKLEYENVHKKLRKGTKIDKHAYENTMRSVKSDTSNKEVQKIYNKFLNGYNTPEDKTLFCYTNRLRSLHAFVCYKVDIKRLDQERIETVEIYCKEILKSIGKSRK